MENNNFPKKPLMIYEVEEGVTSSKNDELQKSEIEDVDCIPQSFYDSLPKLLKEACGIFNDKHERDVFLYSALSVLGGSFHHLYAFNAVDKKKVAVNLLTFIVAPAASGKGTLNYSKKLITDIRKSFSTHAKKLGSKDSVRLLIPVNISSGGLIQSLKQNDGVGIMVESEIDTLVNANKQDWGNYSDILRNAFENESASLYRKTDKEHHEIENIKLSLAISGTPNQFKNLMYSVENGLFSRGCYYVFGNSSTQLKCFDRISTATDIDTHFANLAKIANEYYEQHLAFDKLYVVFGKEQLEKIEIQLQMEFDRTAESPELQANIKRSFIIAQKVAAILTYLQEGEKGTISDKIKCSDSALNMAIQFTLTSLKHSYKAYELLPIKRKSGLNINQQRLLFDLPKEFSRDEAVKKAVGLGVHPKTIDNCLKALKDKGCIEMKSHGIYQKVA